MRSRLELDEHKVKISVATTTVVSHKRVNATDHMIVCNDLYIVLYILYPEHPSVALD